MRKRTLFNIAVVVVMVLSALGIGLTIAEAVNDVTIKESRSLTREEWRQASPGARSGSETQSDAQNGRMAPVPPDESDDGESIGVPPEMWRGEMEREDVKKQVEPRQAHLGRYVLFLGLFSALFIFGLTSLIASWKFPTFYLDKYKLVIYLLGNVILIGLATAALAAVVMNAAPTGSKNEESASEQVNFDETNAIEAGVINLDERDADLTIKNGGTYTLSGNLSHSVVIDVAGENVEIVLSGAKISSSQTAAIVGLAASKITINLADGTENTLSDGGNSDYDGAIFSNAELVFEGNGTLTVSGQQDDGEGIASEAQNITFNSGTYNINASDDGINAGGDGGTITINGGNFYINAGGDGIDSNQDAVINGGTVFVIGSSEGGNAGIDTETGYAINGGTVVALGSDMLEAPKSSSKQNVLALTLGQTVAGGTNLALSGENGTVVAFQAPKSFRTVLISAPNLMNGSYTLLSGGQDDGELSQGIYQGGSYSGGSPLTAGQTSSFEVSQIVNNYGGGNGQGGPDGQNRQNKQNSQNGRSGQNN